MSPAATRGRAASRHQSRQQRSGQRQQPQRPRSTVVSSARSRFAARRRRTRWQSARPMLVVTALAAAAVVLVWLVMSSSVLAVNRVAVQGVGRLSAADVAAAADVALGTPLARVDVGAVQRRVAALAPVASVRVDRDWPHVLRVVVRERVAVATIPAPDGVVLLDRDAVPFGKQTRAPRGTVRLHVTGPVPGEGQPSARAALSVWRSLPAKLQRLVVDLRASTPSAVTLTLRGGRSVVWGAPADSGRKAAVLDVLLRRPARVYDVSAPGVAVTR